MYNNSKAEVCVQLHYPLCCNQHCICIRPLKQFLLPLVKLDRWCPLRCCLFRFDWCFLQICPLSTFWMRWICSWNGLQDFQSMKTNWHPRMRIIQLAYLIRGKQSSYSPSSLNLEGAQTQELACHPLKFLLLAWAKHVWVFLSIYIWENPAGYMLFIHSTIDCHNIMRRIYHCSQSSDTSEKGGWGVPLTTHGVKCATACCNLDLMQSHLFLNPRENSCQLIPSCKSPCEATLFWKHMLT